MAIITQDFLDFLKDLSKNNNREWFEQNKKRYEKSVKEPFTRLMAELIRSFQSFAPEIQIEPKESLYRINRDIRFSKDKSPYKTHIAGIISRYGRKNHEYPGYYLHVEFGALMFGGGAYFLEKESLAKVRQSILLQPERFRSIIHDPDFVAKYESVKGEKNKKIPAEFAALAETLPEIANKQFYFMAEMDPKIILKENAVDFLTAYAKTAQPLMDFLQEALGQ